MNINFHPLALGVMLIVAVGTAAYTLWTSRRTEQSHHHYSRRNVDECYAEYNFQDDGDDETIGTRSQRRSRKAINSEKCSICLTTLSNNLKTLRCFHVFHAHCINAWIKQNNTCPVCRATAQQ